MKRYRGNGLKYLWTLLYVYLLMVLVWILSDMTIYNFLVKMIIPTTLIGLLAIFSVLWSRDYDIYLFDAGIGLHNKWKFIGLNKWKIKFNEIKKIEIKIPNSPASGADFQLKINDKVFFILIKKSNMIEIVERLLKEKMNIEFDKNTLLFFDKNGITLDK